MKTIKDACKQFKLSRSTLLYYDSIGLLKPSARTDSNYRLYTDADMERLKMICNYRKAGISLNDISKLLEVKKNEYTEILIERYNSISHEMENLQHQQEVIIRMMNSEAFQSEANLTNIDNHAKVTHTAGMDKEAARKWHIMFEAISPSEHTKFLKKLGMDDEAIHRIKLWK
ncbi:MAG: MerR family transcriptional regulator [Defluviitaleaceae bacterium]|nr:MerR family transcriptional regulator [Defluviitaleaceae bacterium]